jgi:formate/nitrite transporter FocA (FNT family)
LNNENKIIGPDGQEILCDDHSQTNRSIERSQEDKDYVPVILKRNDQAIRHPDDILERAIEEGLEQHKRPNLSLFLSAIAAGLILGFAGMCVAVITQLSLGGDNLMLNRITVAFIYPLGFIISIMSGTQLFTEHTATALYPALDNKVQVKSLLTLWAVVLIGNFVGTFLSSSLIYMSDAVISAEQGFIQVAHHLTQFTFKEVFFSALLAGWLMAQGAWLVLATAPTSSQIICIFIVTFIIGVGGLHHSIAGSAEIFSGLLHSEHPNYFGSAKFLISAVLGNLLGGSFFVGVLNYAHIKKTQ